MTVTDASATADAGAGRRVILANPRGFCAGVVRAIDTVERALARYGPPVYVRRPIVHNRAVLERLEALGAVFVQEVDDVPPGSFLILSAHGVAPEVIRSAQRRGMRIIDAMCPLVAKVHAHVVAGHRAGRFVLLVGHPGHPEVVGTMGQVPRGAVALVSSARDVARLDLPADTAITYAVQTTFAVREAVEIIEAIRRRFDDFAEPRSASICYATTNRQTAVEAVARQSDYVVIVGDPMSSNANRLVEVALSVGCPAAALAAGQADLDWATIGRSGTVGISAAASTPSSSVDGVCQALIHRGFSLSEYDGVSEFVSFKPVSVEV